MVLRRAGLQALRALLELAQDPNRWRSVNEIAAAQQLPAPMLEQLLLQLRRGELVEARRGRLGGYRLRQPPAAIPVAKVLAAVGASLDLRADLEFSGSTGRNDAPAPSGQGEGSAEEMARASSAAEQRVINGMVRRLQTALDRELASLTLEELLFDLSSWQEILDNGGGVMLG